MVGWQYFLPGRLKYVGYGNGHKKSKEFEEFVLEKRRILKEDLRLCERATQKILLYSNNFLHKKLKTEEVMEALTLKVQITTKVICFSCLLKCLRSLYVKQCGLRSDCSYRSSLFWVQAVCFYT